ncbi:MULTISPECIES: NAD(P)/FAD-dependent oxidoreductase [unclassified Polaribacter]|jgi:sulfide:quinone oxidoreductase|uniref:type III sulfide quinone reductase, selenoprotein subtype n=1 Tax=unclassified Polaribacter TaxID=196858 RepID=UPI00052CE34B|nr:MULTISPECIES: FAD/NAD(P)-binding oxidoreductase [unclassified Polaribacter]KGL59166.1 oxidoreductase (flavoprotein) [Polaribacter sp. Hel1_33_49]MBT4413172.1 NAD(P)/FAD-dependent oxidoreductase [Polaribacter sp.]MDG1402241.1 FAD/NAD(P)-binding oxidoreductase [Polaribacter sp.]MDG2435925.1 FAD/NAD(P)-binding oxidoreductase [Polaribacter sp.]PKV64400.1 sulfide:quinone oxidoreductase [Polaribacter sp. Hel1_33_96]
MKNLVILGAGTAGTMMANHLVSKLKKDIWKITIIDQYKTHYYQPGFLFLPFDIYTSKQVKKNGKKFIPKEVNYIQEKIEKIIPDKNEILLESNKKLDYDLLIIATGTKIAPEETEGMAGPMWHKNIFDFYTYEGAKALRDKFREWEGGKLVIHITEMPIKCPVAPLEFAFLADSYFKNSGIRDKVDITFVTPLDGAFTKPKATQALHYLLEEKGIKEVTDFNIERVDYENNKIIDYADTEVDYDLLVTVPTNMGDSLIERSGLGDDLNFVPTNKATLQTTANENIFALGDCTNLPASKAGSVAHFEAEILTENILRYIDGKELKEKFDGHANCFIETGNGKALLIDFNYTQEPVEGTFPFPGVGPLSLLKESRINHMGKMAFKWIYWNMLIKGIHIPFVSATMSKKGKQLN